MVAKGPDGENEEGEYLQKHRLQSRLNMELNAAIVCSSPQARFLRSEFKCEWVSTAVAEGLTVKYLAVWMGLDISSW